MKRYYLVLLSIALSGCPATPKVIAIQNGNESQLNCQQLSQEINAAEQARIAAHKEDHFRASDIFPPTGAISVANIWRADGHATERLALLNRIANEKGCLNRPYGSNAKEIILAEYVPQEAKTAESTGEKPAQPQADKKESAPIVKVDDIKAPEDEDLLKDQDSSAYVIKGYDAESFPRINADTKAAH